ncbi:ThiF family adenylyltransferase [Pseudomonas sp. N3-W]|uniref:ThiF family adenylyltransferase n=1 Tax=Pseudomonas fungipugnans TaxID=3024217 RepID=A0ABT6QH61_9PSED|nr:MULTISPECIES: ThiF family adenylyltransferase [unclassified Pseudomonas]MDI2590215.1 ThiF family adenylyltransferase [Pseudomonas sp. 681]UWF52131.1 ThiF family adenylyltransferase [Pseudomonas sp. N3-W]
MSNDNMLNRSVPLLTDIGIEKLAACSVVIAGCGGVGGAMALTLCRMGVETFKLADPGVFDPPDMNRQWAATGRTMGRNKALVYRELILDLNPRAKVEIFVEGITDSNQGEFLSGADIMVDCLDASVPYSLRESLHRKARQQGIFSVVGPIMGFGCFAICSSPKGLGMEFWTETLKVAKEQGTLPPVFDEIFVPQHMQAIVKSLEVGKVPTVAVGPLIATSLLATECVNYLLHGTVPGFREPIVLPKVMFFDLNRMNYKVIDVCTLSEPA